MPSRRTEGWVQRIALAVGVASALQGCEPEVPHFEPTLVPRMGELVIQPGRRYRIELARAGTRADGARTWTGADLSGSPFAYMQRRGLILKLDDYGWALEPASQVFLERLSARGGVAALGIVTGLIPADDRVRATYVRLARVGFELWFHGHTHRMQANRTEFCGPTEQEQARVLELGRQRGLALLGVSFATFGAPGNCFDANTQTAVAGAEWVETWLFGPLDFRGVSLPRIVDAEATVGVVAEPDAVLKALAQEPARAAPVVVLQLHPRRFRPEDQARLDSLLDAIDATGEFRYTTPDAWRRWLAERASVSVSTEDGRVYLVDATRAKTEHRLLLEPLGPKAERISELSP